MKFQTGAAFLGSLLLAAGCASMPETPPSLSQAGKPGWSFDATPEAMIVSVSPAGKTLRVAGTTGLVVGSGADAVVNAVYRDRIHDALAEYNAAQTFQDMLAERLAEAVGSDLETVAPLGSTAGFQTRREVVDARFANLAGEGYDLVLDLESQYGIYGPSGILATRLDGKLTRLPEDRTVWDETLVVTNDLVLADTGLGDPTKRQGVNVTSPQFMVDDEAVNRWIAEDGQVLRERFEQVVDDAASTLLYALELEENAVGAFHMGKLAMNRKEFEEAAAHFRKALELDPGNAGIINAFAVAMGHNDQIDDAIRMCREIVASNADYGPAHYNLAWWYATEKDDAAAAATHYEKARALGMPENGKVEKKIEKG